MASRKKDRNEVTFYICWCLVNKQIIVVIIQVSGYLRSLLGELNEFTIPAKFVLMLRF